jgi:hypothetical protein
LSKLRTAANERVTQRVAAIEVPHSKQNVRPYYAHTATSSYALDFCEGKETDSPWNTAVALSTEAQAKDLRLLGQEAKVKPELQGAILPVTEIMAALQNEKPLEPFWRCEDASQKTYRLAIQTLASDYWRGVVGFDPLISSDQVSLRKDPKESKDSFVARRKIWMARKIERFHNQLTAHLHKSMGGKSDGLQLALSTTYLLRELGKKDTRIQNMIARAIASIPALTPTMQMLQRLGRVPDCGIKDFKSLFMASEWKVIMGSALFDSEESIKSLMKKKISHENFGRVVEQLGSIGQTVKSDPLSASVIMAKNQRLGITSEWKRKSRHGEKVQPFVYLARHCGDERVRAIFSPQSLLVASNTAHSEEISAWVSYDPKSKCYFVKVPDGVVAPEATAAAREYVSLLNPA